ncbi:hypothetical protein [Streptomyces sp. NBC_00503]|uniref:hypothetical protein n=1 Tax=Streptomyces sp. NBC_00503 TaxID=2903659 RepID=UPI002E809FD3|nr:hypothetical protein [Streptomyces sp. NBC_00503]WUD85159.1 hypothetical protein OG490_33920 [Streptomyces sp. NBC_00503]
MRRGTTEWFLGAADEEIRALEEVPGIDPERLRELWCAEPELMLRLDRLYAAAQRAFERRTRAAVTEDLLRALRAVARGADVARLDTAVAVAGARLEADTATAASRGLNTGLTCGIVVSPVILTVVFALGAWVPGLFGIDFGCQERQALVHALVCFAGGAMGAVFSVIIRLRDPQKLIRTRAGHGNLVSDPVQLAQILRQEGWYRVVVGWFLATSLFLLVSGGILTVLTPPASPADLCGPGPLTAAGHEALVKAWFFWGALGFLAGLNERWAHGLLRHPSAPRDEPGQTDGPRLP